LYKDSDEHNTEIAALLKNYTTDVWYQRFLSLCREKVPKKIVLVSDFINKVGGIETYLHDVKEILEAKGHQVVLRGGYLPKGIKGRLRIYLGLFFAPVNVWSAWRFKRFLKTYQPDLIWFHSLLRNLGGGVVNVAQQYQQSAQQYQKSQDDHAGR
jgi:glycosyltransferase involved in cell wall biosynthesis